MPTDIDIVSQQTLLDAHRRTLQYLLNQRAIHTYAFAPPATLRSIDDARKEIRQIKQTLRGWHVDVEDLPIDEEDDQPTSQARPSQDDIYQPEETTSTARTGYQTPLLLGVMLDVSQPMQSTIRSMPKKSGLSSRSMDEAVQNLRNQIVALRRARQTKSVLPNIYLFLYAFGASRLQHAVYNVFLRDAGMYTDKPVDNRPIRDIFAEVAEEADLPPTPSADLLDDNWDTYRQGIDDNLADLISGGPPSLYGALQQVLERLRLELQTKQIENVALLLISSGRAEAGLDSKVVAVANDIKRLGADIICCYVYKANVVRPYILYDEPQSTWPSEALTLFECASSIKANSSFCKALVNTLVSKSWKMSENSRFFVQVNQSKLLKDVIDSINKSMPQ